MNSHLFGFSKQDTNTKCIELAGRSPWAKEKEIKYKMFTNFILSNFTTALGIET